MKRRSSINFTWILSLSLPRVATRVFHAKVTQGLSANLLKKSSISLLSMAGLGEGPSWQIDPSCNPDPDVATLSCLRERRHVNRSWIHGSLPISCIWDTATNKLHLTQSPVHHRMTVSDCIWVSECIWISDCIRVWNCIQVTLLVSDSIQVSDFIQVSDCVQV